MHAGSTACATSRSSSLMPIESVSRVEAEASGVVGLLDVQERNTDGGAPGSAMVPGRIRDNSLVVSQ